MTRSYVVITVTVLRSGPFLRARKQLSRSEIKSYKPEFKELMAHRTEDSLCGTCEIFDEDPRFAAAVNAFRAGKKGKL
jgi:hypothetical protein